MDQYCRVWIATGFAYFQYLFLVETGSRMDHGNWGWGVCVMAFLLFAVSLEELLRHVEQQWNRRNWGRLWVCVCWALLGWHTACGAVFLLQYLIQGAYFAV